MSSMFERIAALTKGGASAVVVTVVRTSGSTPRSAGAKMLVHPDGTIEGTIGGGRIEHEMIALAEEVLHAGAPRLVERQLTAELGMCCGGSVAVFLEPLIAAPPLLIFGAGHVGMALCAAASQAHFAVHVIDERASMITGDRFADATALHDLYDDADLPFAPNAFVLVATHDHALDQQLLEKALRRQHRWVGVIGSRRKAELTRQRLAHKGFDEALIRSVRCPIGLAIGAETPQEIAVSVLAELIAVRRGATIAPSAPHLEQKAPR